MNDKLQTSGDVRLVQFPHPGGEHPRPRDGKVAWRRADENHRRTFLVSSGTYRSAVDGEDEHGDVAFWGEWEGSVDLVTDIDPTPDGRGPHWLGRPDASVGTPVFEDGTPAQNTDPFVWGDAMRYTFCRQPGNGNLRRLGRGSVILFGSDVGQRFVIDTVLVVAGWIDHSKPADLETLTNDAHMRATIEPMYGWGEGATHRLYVGATPAKPVDGMFSFVPCRAGSDSSVGFARPAIELGGWINPNRRQQPAMKELDAAALQAAWREVADVVVNAELSLATELRL